MKQFKHTICDPLGLHARPAGILLKAASGYRSRITVDTAAGSADAKRLLPLLRLAAKQGTELTVTVNGADEEMAAAELQALMQETM